ncbi:MAG: MarC family protein [Kiritimatiellia bacterium]|nr:MarC family protein [Kiritimatiellia bacterium]
METWISATILLFVVMDPFGNIPPYLCILGTVAPERRRRVLIRELLIALFVLLLFFLLGPRFLIILHVSNASLRIAGGIVLFLIAIKMVFGVSDELAHRSPDGEPLIVPLAVPLLAGPSAIATLLLLVAQQPARWPEWLLALFVSWLATAGILLTSARFGRFLGKKGLGAIERLMGLILITVSVEMFIQGVRDYFLG